MERLKRRNTTLKSSTDKLIFLAGLVLLLTACAGPAPKPIVTQPAATPQEQAKLEAASKDYAKALKALAEMKYEQAERLFKEMITQYPNFPGPYANLGIIYMNTEKDAEAQKAFRKALEIKPDFVIVYNQLGLLHRNAGRFDQARQAYEKALEIDPQFAQAHLNAGILYDLYLNDLNKALTHYIRYMEIANPPQEDPVHKWIADLTNRTTMSAPAQEPQ